VILLTGSQGFIGQRVRLALGTAEVTTLDRKPGADLEMDLLDLGTPCDVDTVIHLAAQADISNNWVGDVARQSLYADNILATIQLLEAVRGVKRFVFISTAAIAAGSHSPYVATKIAGEALVQAYAFRYGWEWECIRLVSCVGPGYHHGHVADFCYMATTGQIHARNSGAIKNPFVHVDDAADAIVAAAHKPKCRATFVAAEPWSWRDTVRVMRDEGMTFDLTAPENLEGWIGDPHLGGIVSDYPVRRDVATGVREAVRGLRGAR
jgi:nucleoside-diphosphate-sugar epimerase